MTAQPNDTGGIKLDPAWFKPHFEFRFPILGSVVKDTTTFELRSALEPWNVLGEESAAGGQARYVDSSLERLQGQMRTMQRELDAARMKLASQAAGGAWTEVQP